MKTLSDVETRLQEVVRREHARSVECIYRRPSGASSCAQVDVALGWRCAMHIDKCDECWKAGADSREGAAIRERFVLEAETAILSHRNKAPVGVLLTIAGKRPAKEAKEIIRSVAPRAGEKAIEAASRISAAFEREIRERVAGMTPEEVLEAEGGASRWGKVRHVWQQAQSFSKAVMGGKLDQAEAGDELVLGERFISCFGVTLKGEKVADPCPSLQGNEDDGYYCGDCGCGQKALARLDGVKLRFKKLECPRRRKGFANSLEAKPVPITVSAPVKPRKGEVVIKNVCYGIGAPPRTRRSRRPLHPARLQARKP